MPASQQRTRNWLSVPKVDPQRAALVRQGVMNCMLAAGVDIDEKTLNARAALALDDWGHIPSQHLHECLKLARQTTNYRAPTTAEVCRAWVEIRAKMAQKAKDAEMAEFMKPPKDTERVPPGFFAGLLRRMGQGQGSADGGVVV